MAKTGKINRRFDELDQLAEMYVQHAGIKSPPVDPGFWCSDKEQIHVHVADLRGECDGLLTFRNGKFHLFYAPDKNKGRFTFAHEVGHYLIEEHHAAIRAGAGPAKCLTGFISDKEIEKEADSFAAGLLLPRFLFRQSCPDPNFRDISRVADAFDVSLTATTLRTIAFTHVRSALVVTVDGRIKWYHASEDMVRSGVWAAKIGAPPPVNSKTASILRDLPLQSPQPIEGGECWASDWFKCFSGDPQLWEEVFPLPAYGQILTLLTFAKD